MKKIFALLVALAMLLATAALAEDSTLYSLCLLDPQIVFGEETFDLTNLELDLTAALTDYGPLGLMLEPYAGEDYEYINTLLAQLDGDDFTVYYGGMEDSYTVDLELLTGMSFADLLTMLPLQTMLAGSDLEGISPDALALDAETRIDMLESALGGYVYDSLEQDGVTEHSFSVSREDSAEMATAIVEMLASLSPELEELAEYDWAIELNGTITASGDPDNYDAVLSMDSEGTLYLADDTEEVSVPFTLEYYDDMINFALNFAITNVDETIALALNGSVEPYSDGRNSIDYTLALDVVGEQATLRYAVQPEEDTDRVDTLIEIDLPNDEAYLALDVITDFDPDSAYSFYAALTADDGTGESVVDLYYAGDPVDDPESGLDTAGWAEITVVNPETDPIAINASVYTLKQDLDSADWLLDSSGAIDVTGMTDEDMEAISTEAMTVFQSDLMSIIEKVPALAELLG